MAQIWTIIFVALLGVSWWLASWRDREEQKRHQRRDGVGEKRNERG